MAAPVRDVLLAGFETVGAICVHFISPCAIYDPWLIKRTLGIYNKPHTSKIRTQDTMPRTPFP